MSSGIPAGPGAGRPPRAAVIGGGLAGIAAALDLAAAGWTVVLLERGPVLGGLCRSVADPALGRVDTGQHVYLHCCTALEGLLRRLAVEPAIRQSRLELVMVDGRTGAARRLRAGPGPAPLHLAPPLLRWPGLGSGDRARAARALRHLDRLDAAARRELDAVPFAAWLQSWGVADHVVRRLFEPLIVATCNTAIEACSTGLAAFVIQEGLLRDAGGAALRLPSTDLSAWLDPPARRALAAAGVAVRLRWRATAIGRAPGGGFQVVGGPATAHHEEVDGVVCAVPAAAARRLLPPDLADDPVLAAAAQLPLSPIVNVHLVTDRPILPAPVVTVVESPLQWVFGRAGGARAVAAEAPGGYHAAVSLSAADRWVAEPADRVVSEMWAACHRAFPAARRARLLHQRVTREPQATFAAIAGSGRARPGPATGDPHLALAGSWTDTGWPATMEGAVRSGRRAAAVLQPAARDRTG